MATDERDFLGRAVQALSDGRATYVRALGDAMAGLGAADPISALAGLLAPEGRLATQCAFSYELRLHRARGYGALKAILEILADEESLTLTEISQRLQRTPGSTKDYLSWLEDVDLVTSRQKRYSFTDPLLRVWVRLHCRPSAPTEDDLAREVHRYALPRLPQPSEPPATPPTTEPAFAMAGGPPSGIIEID
jgi:DNA-binding transcriptional ArsR family regulator